MRKISCWTRRFGTVFLFLLLLGSVVGLAAGAQLSRQDGNGKNSIEFMPTSEIKEGMRGVAKTVIHGVEIEEFDVEISSVVPQLVSSGDGILAKVSGDVIDRSGGVVQGMSGSPVYIDGKLVGAVSGAFRNNPDGLAVITPIENMLEVLAQVGEEKGSTVDRRQTYDKSQTPLLVSGLSSRAVDMLTHSVTDWGLRPVQSGARVGGEKASAEHSVQLEPGASVALQWVRGDVNVLAVGTVTYVDGDRFIAFGHTAGNWGKIDAFASTAYVHAIVRSSDLGYKLTSPIAAVGTMTEDRSAGVGGVIGSLPPAVEYEVKVVDKARNKISEFKFEVVRNELFINRFAPSALLGVLDRGIDRVGAGTSRVLYRVYPTGMNPIVRDNMFYSSMDISAVSLGEILELTDAVINNEFQAVDLEKVQLEVEIDSERRTAVIERVKPDQRVVVPGESVFIEVILRPYRGKRETKIIRLDIPKEAQPSTVHVTVRGGGVGYLSSQSTPYHQETSDENGKFEDIEETQLPTEVESLEKLIKDYIDRPRNHELVAEFIPYLDPFPAPEDGAVTVSGTDSWNDQPNPVRSTLVTQYCVVGELGFDLTIIDPAVDSKDENSSEEASIETIESLEDIEEIDGKAATGSTVDEPMGANEIEEAEESDKIEDSSEDETEMLGK